MCTYIHLKFRCFVSGLGLTHLLLSTEELDELMGGTKVHLLWEPESPLSHIHKTIINKSMGYYYCNEIMNKPLFRDSYVAK